MSTKNLQLLGALFAQSTADDSQDTCLGKVIRAARAELDDHPKLEREQFQLWRKSGRPDVVVTK